MTVSQNNRILEYIIYPHAPTILAPNMDLIFWSSFSLFVRNQEFSSRHMIADK
jgi:hypothetical protein